MLDEPFAQPQQQDQQRQQQQQQQQTTRSRGTLIAERRLSPANLVDKLKMAFSDKRKQPILVTKPNSRHNRPLSHPGRWRRDEDMDVDEDDEDGFNSDDQIAGSSSSSYASPSSSPPQRSPMHLARTLSRQSTNPLGNILEESIHTWKKKIIFFLFFEFMQNFSSIFSLAYPPFLSSCLLLPVR